jgi:hypothetical protein
VGSVTLDGGADPANPPSTSVSNFQTDLPAGTSPLGTIPAADGSYARVIADALVVAPRRTVNVRVAEMADGIADRCSFDGLAVPSG